MKVIVFLFVVSELVFVSSLCLTPELGGNALEYNFFFLLLQNTDDMEIAPDFFSYFEAAADLLDKDKYVL